MSFEINEAELIPITELDPELGDVVYSPDLEFGGVVIPSTRVRGRYYVVWCDRNQVLLLDGNVQVVPLDDEDDKVIENFGMLELVGLLGAADVAHMITMGQQVNFNCDGNGFENTMEYVVHCMDILETHPNAMLLDYFRKCGYAPGEPVDPDYVFDVNQFLQQ